LTTDINTAFLPELNKLYTFEKHCLLFLKKGQGTFQVDFRNYTFEATKAIFLSPKQYFKLLAGKFVISVYEFSEESIIHSQNSRFLFRHLVSVSHLDFDRQKASFLNPLQYIDINNANAELLAQAIQDWINLNPFHASSQDVNLLFDLKEIIDKNFREPMDVEQVSKALNQKPYRITLLAKEKLNYTIHKLVTNKILLEAERKIVFTDLSTKEIAYETGFSDPAYFNRFFKQQTTLTPHQFREKHEFDRRDTFAKDLMELIDAHYKTQHRAEFYADQFAMTVKSFSKKINDRLDTSIKDIIKDKIIAEAKSLIVQHMAIHAIAYELGFQEPNHFTAFFKAHTGQTPTQFLADL
jgi:AraC-like DNA-binding protein